jgi:hypothetical protein
MIVAALLWSSCYRATVPVVGAEKSLDDATSSPRCHHISWAISASNSLRVTRHGPLDPSAAVNKPAHPYLHDPLLRDHHGQSRSQGPVWQVPGRMAYPVKARRRTMRRSPAHVEEPHR